MADGTGQPAAGWYDDPHREGQLRYFDGQAWTDHLHQPGTLPEVGTWLNSTFTVLWQYRLGALLIALAVSLFGNLLVWLSVRPLIDDLALVDDDFVNFTWSKGVVAFAVVLGAWLWQAFGWLTLNRFLHRAHFHANPTVGEAASRALKRLPKLIVVYLAIALGALLAMFVLVAITALIVPLGLILFFLAIPFGCWVVVKLWFVSAAIAAAPSDAPVLASSAGVSTGRFWAITGRLLMFFFALIVAGSILAAILQDYGSPTDQSSLDRLFVQTDGGFEFASDFSFRDFLLSGNKFYVSVLIASVLRAVSSVISTSAYMRLYLDSGAPSDL